MRVMDVRARHIKGCMEEGVATVRGQEQTPSASMKNKIKIYLLLIALGIGSVSCLDKYPDVAI